MLGGNIFSYALDYKESNSLMSFAHDLGCRAVDTADVYSKGTSERIIGKSLKAKRKEWFIATKVGVSTNEKIHLVNSKQNIFNRVEASLERLKTDYIDLYQLHHFDRTVKIEESLDALEKLREQGKILNYGVSNFKPKHFQNFPTKNLYQKGIYSNQVHFNIVNRNAEFLYKNLLEETEMKLIAYNILGRGLFKGDFLQKKKFKSFRLNRSSSVKNDLNSGVLEILKVLNKYTEIYNLSIPELALRYVIEKPFIKHAIVGVRTNSQLKQLTMIASRELNVKWTEIIKRIDQALTNKNLDLGSNNFYEF